MIGVMIQTAFLVVAILAVQKLLGNKLHAYVRYGLWLLVALRLLIPVNVIDSPFSMLQVAEMIQLFDAEQKSTNLQRADSAVQADVLNKQEASVENILQSINVGMDAENTLPGENAENTAADAVEIEASDSRQADAVLRTDGADRKENDTARSIDAEPTKNAINAGTLSVMINNILYVIWLIGSVLVGGFLGFSYIRSRRKLRRTRTTYKGVLSNADNMPHIPVYRVKNLESPCLVGLLNPSIYIGTDIDMDSDYFRYAIIHEQIHYLHRDYLWAFVRAVLVTVYWFHPFVWLAAVYSVKDGEIACDYGTIRRLGKEERFAYGEMLLNLSKIQRGKEVYTYGTMLRPSKSELKRRILRLTQTNGCRAWAGILAALLMVIAVGCAFTGAAEIDDGKEILMVNEADTGSTDVVENDNANEVADSGDVQSENRESNGSENLPDNADADIIEPRQLEAKSVEVSGDTPFGVDGPHLDYAGGMGTDKGSRIIFHDYFGLIVYDLDNREIARSLDLASIGCDMTQGDDYCQVAVSEDGATVWLHPISKRYMYRYEVAENLLYQEPLVKTFEVDLETEELFDRYLNLSMEPEYTDENTDWSWWHSNYLYEQYKDAMGLHNAYIYLEAFPDNISDTVDYKLMLRNLECVWDDMVFTLFKNDADINDSADIPKEIPLEKFQDNQIEGASVTANADGFPYNYQGNVLDEEIRYDKPCNYIRISDVFGGRRHPITGEVIWHEGIDYSAAEGTDIWAAADGVVYETGYSAEYGNYVVLLHINGDMTYYCHCQGIIAKKDDKVKRGDKIATVGSSGRSTGPHLHFALSRSGWFVNPESYMEVVLDLD